MFTILHAHKVATGQLATDPTTLPNTPKKRHPLRQIFIGLVGLILFAPILYFALAWPWLSRWGATDAEVQKALPGDELVPAPAFVTTKAVTIHAPPEAIYAWLLQLGVDRGGMYSYLWVENWLLRLHVKNTNEIRPEWQQVNVGDFIRFTPKDYPMAPGPGFYVMALEPNRTLIACFGLENAPPVCNKSATWQFVLEPQQDGTTRLLLRGRSADPGSAVGFPGSKDSFVAMAAGKLAQIFPFYMERKMLLTIKERAEQLASASVR